MGEKIEKAILRIQHAHKIAKHNGNTLICAYSGGKDSDVLLDLCIKSGVDFRAEHNHTTVDAPETVYHIRAVFEQMEEKGLSATINYPELSMWELIVKKVMSPTRLARYCCEYLKERRFDNQHILLGVRWAESQKRKERGIHETLGDKKSRVLFTDNEIEKMYMVCYSRSRFATNPIIDWTDAEIWEYIKENNLTVNPLYNQGFKRVGCVGCPLGGYASMRQEFIKYPKYKKAYIRAFERMIQERNRRGLETSDKWGSAENVFKWWIDPKFDPNQLTLEDCEALP